MSTLPAKQRSLEIPRKTAGSEANRRLLAPTVQRLARADFQPAQASGRWADAEKSANGPVYRVVRVHWVATVATPKLLDHPRLLFVAVASHVTASASVRGEVFIPAANRSRKGGMRPADARAGTADRLAVGPHCRRCQKSAVCSSSIRHDGNSLAAKRLGFLELKFNMPCR